MEEELEDPVPWMEDEVEEDTFLYVMASVVVEQRAASNDIFILLSIAVCSCPFSFFILCVMSLDESW